MRFIPLLIILSGATPIGYALEQSWMKKFFTDNFTFKKEIFLQITTGHDIEADPPLYSRQSVGFDALKKFSTKTSTIAAFDLQSRLMRRDICIDVLNDMEGKDRAGFTLEYHNVYLDLCNIFNPLLNESGRNKNQEFLRTLALSPNLWLIQGAGLCLNRRSMNSALRITILMDRQER
jgi:hypothetical protein